MRYHYFLRDDVFPVLNAQEVHARRKAVGAEPELSSAEFPRDQLSAEEIDHLNSDICRISQINQQNLIRGIGIDADAFVIFFY